MSPGSDPPSRSGVTYRVAVTWASTGSRLLAAPPTYARAMHDALPEPPDTPPIDDATALRLSVRNAAAFWSAIARTRGHELVQRPGLLAVLGGPRAGLRILLLGRTLDIEARTTIDELVGRNAGLPVTIEDQFAATDFAHLGLGPISLPVMSRRPAPAPTGDPAAGITVSVVGTVEQVRAAEDVVVHGFPLQRMQPLTPGEAFPDDLLWYPGVRLFLAASDGSAAGACLTVDEGTCGGVYWVTTLEEQRSKGIGRAVMQAALAPLESSPVSLTATAAGEPLYRAVGFRTVGLATWWS